MPTKESCWEKSKQGNTTTQTSKTHSSNNEAWKCDTKRLDTTSLCWMIPRRTLQWYPRTALAAGIEHKTGLSKGWDFRKGLFLGIKLLQQHKHDGAAWPCVSEAPWTTLLNWRILMNANYVSKKITQNGWRKRRVRVSDWARGERETGKYLRGNVIHQSTPIRVSSCQSLGKENVL